MHDASAVTPPNRGRLITLRARLPTLYEVAFATASALLLVLAFPNFDLWWLAWIGLAPLLFVVARTRHSLTAFLLGVLWGTLFFYGTCWWLSYPMIHYGRVPAALAYPLLLLPVVLVSIFPGLACAFVFGIIRRFGSAAIFAAPLIWVTFDWLRYAVTGQVWNALGYSQAFHPIMIQPARLGGVYVISLLILITNTALAFIFIKRSLRAFIMSSVAFVAVIVCIADANLLYAGQEAEANVAKPGLVVIAVQPNVPMEGVDDATMKALLQRHLELSNEGLRSIAYDASQTRLVIWPESPMNFTYARDPKLQSMIADFTRSNRTSLLLNSLEPAPDNGGYNSAILVNEQGQKAAQYDKIRLMPFGEYVPLPRWLPGSGSVRSIVGEFTPGNSYTLMPLGALRAGVFICIEAVHPGIARSFTNAGADVLINISNDGYLGPTPVMRQHLANAVFRAVENDRPLVRVTNAGISALIWPDGSLRDQTSGFQDTVRTWTIGGANGSTFYTRHGDLFVYGCALISLGIISATFMTRKRAPACSEN